MGRFLLLTLISVLPAALLAQQHCETLRAPNPLPIPLQLVDSAALDTAGPHVVLPPTTFSLWYADDGVLTHVLALADSLVTRGDRPPDSATVVRTRVAAAIGGAAFPQDSSPHWSVRFTVARDTTGAVSLAVAHSVFCTRSRS